MEQTAKIFSIGMPIFLILIIFEKLYGKFKLKGNDTVPIIDALSSAYSGLLFVLRALFGLGISIVSYQWMYEHLAIIHIETTWLVYLSAFIAIDFEFYWGHRFHHEINFLWYRHIIHHNSEEFNIATSIRQPFLGFINFLFILSLPAALLGLSPVVMSFLFPIHRFISAWYHTRLIGKLGFLEKIIITPSQHRVHHALNPIYIDKNHGSFFNIWDKLFGTFQEELDSEPPVYGVTRPSQSFNPITNNLDHLILLIKDAWRADKWIDKITIWFRPTGWRPDGFEEKYPVTKISDHNNFKKFSPQISNNLLLWSTFQFFTLFIFFIYILQNVSLIGTIGICTFAIYMIVQIFSAAELMNRNKWASTYTLISTLVCFGIYLFDSTWFGMSRFYNHLPFIFLTYFVLQTIVAFAFNKKEDIKTFSEEGLTV